MAQNYKGYGFTVRCLRDLQMQGLPTVTTAAVNTISQTTATSGGNVTSDGVSDVTARGVCWSTSSNPTLSDSHTTDGSGTGEFVSNITNLNSNTQYNVRAYATNNVGTAYGDEQIFTTLNTADPCPGTPTVTYEGQTYNTVLIGSQCWMKENLNVGTMINGNQSQANNGVIEKYCYNNNASNCETYGGLYQWDEAMQYSAQQGVQGICPPGWHIPTHAEWTALTNYVSSIPDYLCNNNSTYIAKSLAATTNWNTNTNTCAIGNNLSANNTTGFTALPGGKSYTDGSFLDLGNYGQWWSSTENGSSFAWYRGLYYDTATVPKSSSYKTYGVSLRCLKD